MEMKLFKMKLKLFYQASLNWIKNFFISWQKKLLRWIKKKRKKFHLENLSFHHRKILNVILVEVTCGMKVTKNILKNPRVGKFFKFFLTVLI